MAVSYVFCEINPDTKEPIRIFKNNKDAYVLPSEQIARWPRGEAVKSIREQVFIRSGGRCEICAIMLNRLTGELHEKHPRGQLRNGKYGEYSLQNSIFLCRSCHTSGPSAQHADRHWQSARIDK